MTLLVAMLSLHAIACRCSQSERTSERRHVDLASQIERLSVPPGFHVTIFADDVPNARGMVLEPTRGTLYVGSKTAGKVYAIQDEDGDGRADRRTIVDEGLVEPVGLDLHEGALYVSARDRILRYDDIEARFETSPEPVIVIDRLPNERSHGWKFIRFGPDGFLYVPIGAPCNICDRGDPYASILRMSPDGDSREVYARGVRNTVGFDWHPVTRELWFTDNGRDRLGDDQPPDELNHAPHQGLHFGYPYCHGNQLLDPEYGRGRSCESYMRPVQELGPHVAALGMRFYTGTVFPRRYHGAIFIAEHGSWNRSVPIGYRVTVVRLDAQGRSLGYETFMDGWLGSEGAFWGRPVDVVVRPDGALLVSDDFAGCIYLVRYSPSS